MKKALSILIAALLVVGLVPGFALTANAAPVASGTVDDIDWVLTDDGTLTFSGTGAIPNYTLRERPTWYNYEAQIEKVVIESGITKVGNNAFNGCSALSELILPDTLTEIRNNVFHSCANLSYVEYWGTTEPTIGNGVFTGCDNLLVVHVPTNYEGDSFTMGLNVSKTLVASAATITGITGNCTWTFDDTTGTLTISGNGAIGSDQSWIEHVNSITSIVIEDGVTSIANNAFRNHSSLESVTLSASVATIGNTAFYRCSSLATVNYLGTSAPSIGTNVFMGSGVMVVNVPVDYQGDTFGDRDVVKNLTSALPTLPTPPTQAIDFYGGKAPYFFICNHCGALSYADLTSAQAVVGDIYQVGDDYFCDITWDLNAHIAFFEDFSGDAHREISEVPDTLTTTVKWNETNGKWDYPDSETIVYERTCKELSPTITGVTFNSDSPAYDAATNTFTISDEYPLILTVTGNDLKDQTVWMRCVVDETTNKSLYLSDIPSADDEPAVCTIDINLMRDFYQTYGGDFKWFGFKIGEDEIDPDNVIVLTVTLESNHVTIDPAIENGTVTAPSDTEKGETVTLTVTPDEGYKLETLTVTDKDGNPVALDETNSFVMPAGGVTVSATFREVQYVDVDEVNAAIEELQAVIEDLKTEIESGSADVDEIKNRLDVIDSIIETLEQSDAAVDGKITEAVNDAKADMQAVIDALKLDINADIADLQQQITANGGDLVGILASITEINQKLAILETASSAVDGKISTAVNDVKRELQGAITDLKDLLADEVQDLQEQITANDTDIEGIRESMTAIDQIIEALKEADKTLDANIGKAIDNAKKELKELIDTVSGNLQNTIDDLQDQITANDTDIADILLSIEEINKTIEVLKTADETLDGKITKTVNDAKKDLKELVDALSDRLDEEVKNLQDQITANDTDIADILLSIEEINKTIVALKTADETLDGKITKTINDAKKDLQELINALSDRLGKAVEDLQKQIDSNDGDISNIMDELVLINQMIKLLEEADVTLDGKITKTVNDAKKDLQELINALEDRLEKAVENLQDQIDSNDEDIEGILESIRDIRDLIAALVEADKALDTKITETVKNAKEELQSAINALEDRLEKAVENLQDQITSNDEDIEGIQESIREINRLIDLLEQADKDLDDKIDETKGELQNAIDKVAQDLVNAEAALTEAIIAGDEHLAVRINALNKAIDRAVAAYKEADAAMQAELLELMTTAAATLDAAIKTVQKNLDSAKAELTAAIATGDSALDAKLSALNDALNEAKAALEAADSENKAALTASIDEAKTALQSAIDALASELESVKNALTAKDNELAEKDSELNGFITVVCIMSAVALAGCVGLAIWVAVDRKKR